MTKEEKQVLLEAAERIFDGTKEYSCLAISIFAPRTAAFALRVNYGKFYIEDHCEWWPIDERDPVGHRIMLLLWFREVGLSGIGEG